MKKSTAFCSILAVVTVLSFQAPAKFKGSISFTASEKADHAANVSTVMSEASACLEAHYAEHRKYFKEYGISKYYGDQSSFAKMGDVAQRKLIRNLGLKDTLRDEMEPMSCIGLTLACLDEGFKAANESPYWEKILAYVKLNGTDGESLQAALQALGWKILYWNPDPTQNAAWDAADAEKDPGNKRFTWGYHAVNYVNATTKHYYFFNHVDDAKTLVGFGTKVPESFTKLPYFIGTAHMGYHVFSGALGKITEGHSTRKITDKLEIQQSMFNPLTANGGPRGGTYRSGIIVVPPGYGF